MRLTTLLLCLCALAAVTPPASAGLLGSMWDGVVGGAVESANYIASLFGGDVEVDEDCISWPPKFCKDLDCPRFVCVNKTVPSDEYTIRRYDASHWVKTSMTGDDNFEDARYTMFMRLFGYIQGDNEARKKIPMTVPVLFGMIPKADDTYEANFNMSFFLKMDNAPTPTHQEVQLVDLPEVTVYVRKFGGFASDVDYVEQAKLLREVLPEGTQYVHSYFYALGYDSPWTIFGRRNEVWYMGA